MERTRPLAEEAERELAAPLAKRLDIRSLLERDGETLKLLVKSDGSHQLAATRLPGGRITLDPPWPPAGREEEETWDIHVGRIPHTLAAEFIKSHMPWAKRKVSQILKRKHPEAAKLDAAFMREHYGWESRESAAEAALCAALLRTAAEGTHPGDIHEAIEREWSMTVDLARASHARNSMNMHPDRFSVCTHSQYNSLMKHERALGEAREETPLAAMIWWNRFARLDGNGPEGDGPEGDGPGFETGEELAAEVRRRLGMKPAEWCILMDIGHIGINNHMECSTEEDMEEIRAGTAALAQANLPDPCPALAAAALMERQRSLEIRRAGNPEAWRSWVWATRQTMLSHQGEHPSREELKRMAGEAGMWWGPNETECGEYAAVLANIGHAILWHARNGQRWRNSNWRNLMVQASRWMEDIYSENGVLREMIQEAQAEDERRRERDLRTDWDSLVGEHRAGELTVRPVTSSQELYRVGSQMKNCLPHMARPCIEGGIRIFTIHTGNGEVAGAGAIGKKTGSGWRAGEVQTTGEGMEPGEARRLMENAARMYQEAERAAERRTDPGG